MNFDQLFEPSLPAGYGGFRSGEKDSSLGNRPVPPTAQISAKRFCRAPGRPPRAHRETEPSDARSILANRPRKGIEGELSLVNRA
jgi:hypothetical protein